MSLHAFLMAALLALAPARAAGPAAPVDAATPVSSDEELFQDACAAYRRGELERAAEGYLALLRRGVVDGELYYDLGNTLYRRGELGRAILAWRRAELLLPRDPDVAANLEHARAEVRDRLEPPSPVPPALFWQRGLAPAESWTLAALLGGLGFLLVALARARGRNPRLAGLPGGLGWAGLLSLLLALLLGGSTLYLLRALQERPVAVVLVPELVARSALGPQGVELFRLHEGAELEVVERAGGHALLLLPDGRRGWVPESAVGLVQPSAPFPETPGDEKPGEAG